MYPIVAPITTGQYGPEIKNLQDVILYLLETGILNNAGPNISLSQLNDEREQSFFGDYTTQFVELFKTQYFLQSNPNELVNNPVADAMNGFVNSQFPDINTIYVEGTVSHISGNLLPSGYPIKIEQVLISSNTELGNSTTGALGEYEVSFDSSLMTTSGSRWGVRAVVEINSVEYPSPILYVNTNELRCKINIVVDIDIDVDTEYFTIKSKMLAIIGSIEIKDIVIDEDESQDIFIANSINESQRDVRLMVIAHRLSDQLDDMEAELFYALLKGNLPEKAELLIFPSRTAMRGVIDAAAERNVIQTFDTVDVDAFTGTLKPTIITNWNTDNSSDLEKTITYRLYNTVLQDDELTNSFMDIFFSFENFDVNSNDFWEYLENNFTEFDSFIDGLKTITLLGLLTCNNPALAKELLNILDGGQFSGTETLPIVSGIYQPELLGRLSLDNWEDIMTDSKSNDSSNFLFPPFVEGGNDAEKIDYYADRLFKNIRSIFTIQNIAVKIAEEGTSPLPHLKDNLDTFLSNNPGLDLRALSILALKADSNIPYDLTGISDIADFIEEIAIVQRLTVFTDDYEVMSALASDSLISAFHVTTLGKEAFVDTYETVFGDIEKASAAFDVADSIVSEVVTKFYASYSDSMSESIGGSFTPIADPIPIGETAPTYPFVDPYADWRTLFGSLDSCSCCHCESIYSPSAYFVDTLHFIKLKAFESWSKLMNRRPDLFNLELTCDNSDIQVPQIDIINEMLEDLISIGYVNARQTRAEAKYQRAIPEYMNTSGYTIGPSTINSPYPTLKSAVYPWTLPYNVFKRQIDQHLNIAEVKPYDLVQRFGEKDLLNRIADLDFCRNYIGATEELSNLITTSVTLTTPDYDNLQPFYGMRLWSGAGSPYSNLIPDPQKRGSTLDFTESTWISSITGRVDVFLQQTQLSYVDLLELLDCYYLNPFDSGDARKLAILRNSNLVEITTCNLFELKIEPVTFDELPTFLDKLHRFVRLSRQLGWHYYDLDLALRAVASNILNEDGFKKIVHLKYLADTLKLSVEDTCLLFQDVEVLPYRNYRSEDDNCELIDIPDQYTRIFRNEALANAHVPNPFPSSPATTFTTVPKDTFRKFMAGITRLKAIDLQAILEDTYNRYSPTPTADDFTPSKASLSYIYRQSILMRSLKLNIDLWLFFMQWNTDGDYFGNLVGGDANNTAAKPISYLSTVSGGTYTANPYDAIRFSAFAKIFSNAGFKASELEFILRDLQTDPVAELKNTENLQLLLGSLRAELAANWYPPFDATNDDASAQLLNVCSRFLDASSVSQLLSIVNREPESSVYTSEEVAFLDTDLIAAIFLNASEVLATPADSDYLSDIEDRYNYVYANAKNYIVNFILKPIIIGYLAKSFTLDGDGVFALLEEVIEVDSLSGFECLLKEDYVLSSGNIDRWVDFYDQFKVINLVQKVSILANRFSLGTQEILYFWKNTVGSSSDPVVPDILMVGDMPVRENKDDVFVPGTSSTATLRLLRNFVQWSEVRSFTGNNLNILFQTIEQEGNVPAAIAAVFHMTQNDVNTLIIDTPPSTSFDGILNIDVSAYQEPLTYLRIIDCLEIQHALPAPMITLYLVAKATLEAEDQDDVAAVIHLVKAPYSNDEWLDVIQPVNDLLRVERRDRMIDYLLAFPPNPYTFSWLSSNDLYETLLVDVEMMPIVQTTRTLLAINSVQIWMTRALLGLEADSISANGARQWATWRKLYRVWEANRKIFIYPENWIEPELRDDKTSLFVELEKFLQQNDVSEETVTSAYKTYLERLDQLSNLDIIGMYRETNKSYQESLPNDSLDTIHVFGRTKEMPYMYFYRKRITGAWSAWEKMEVQIEGDHFVPVVWKGRLRLYWLVFAKDIQEAQGSSIQSEGSLELPQAARWKINLAWTEQKDGNWLAKQQSRDSLFTKYVFEERPLNFDHFNAYKTTFWYKNRQWNDIGDLQKIKSEGINFFSEFDSSGNLRLRVIERDISFANVNGHLSELIKEDPDVTVYTTFGSADDPGWAFSIAMSFWGAYSLSKGSSGWPIGMVPKSTYKPRISNIDTAFEVVKERINREDWGGITGDMTGANEVGLFLIRFNGASAVTQRDTPNTLHSLYSHKISDKKFSRIFKIDLFHNGYWPMNTSYLYQHHSGSYPDSDSKTSYYGYKHFPDKNLELLRTAPGSAIVDLEVLPNLTSVDQTRISSKGYSINRMIVKEPYKSKVLTFPRNLPLDYSESSPVAIPYFFYKDHVNTFFVEKVTLSYDVLETVTSSGPSPAFGELFAPAKIDSVSGIGLGLAEGVGSVPYDIMSFEGEITWGDGATESKASRLFTKNAYRFHNFEHQQVENFLEKLVTVGLDGLLDRTFLETIITDSIAFYSNYLPTDNVHGGNYYPNNKVDFSTEGAYAQYNWELFFHIPMLIANRLSQNQKFDEARKWYHYVFNPNVPFDGASKKRFWNFIPFNLKLGTTETIDYVMKSADLDRSVRIWADNPFKPHLVARTRFSAYMKNTVMKYLDNLIAWGDNLYRTDSREAINEAALLYILSLEILGRRPEQIPPRAKPETQTYLDIYDKLNAFGNVLVDSENVLLSSGAKRHYYKVLSSSFYPPPSPWLSAVEPPKVDFPLKGSMYLFCTPFNEKLLSYWDILADRLFKIRNSQNIDGVTRELALYAPPIDPAILVKAAASGISLTDVLGNMNAPLPSYRFNIITQKASEIANEVKSLGGQLLSAIEKRDAEKISVLRSGQELKVMEAVTELKETQVSESNIQWNVLNVQLKSATTRQNYYKGLIDAGWNGEENTQVKSLSDTIPMAIAQGAMNTFGSIIAAIPQLSGPLPKMEHGGIHLSNVVAAGASILGTAITRNNIRSSVSGIKAGFLRRAQDWNQQFALAKIEIEQLNKQLVASELRIAISEMELRNHKTQVENAREMDTAMREKYTNEELYDWMVSQISYTYFQAYKLAYDTAKKAERSFRYELNLDTSDYIRYGYWDSLKKGLLAGESLSFDLKRMEAGYLDLNKRQLEITKHVSLSALNPDALMNLIASGECEFMIPEWLYDIDYPGQHMRRIKSVSISIPCVAGPYTSINAKLSLTRSRYRKAATMAGASEYAESDLSDTRFNYIFGNIQSIATSSAQNDGGLFELNFRDERYLPFEGCGAISEWRLELPSAVAQFDYNTISDVILHVKYTALDGGSLKSQAKAYVTEMMKSASDSGVSGLYRIFNLKQEFSNEWHQWLQNNQALHLTNIKGRLPYMVQTLMNAADDPKTYTIQKIEMWMDKDFSVFINDSSTAGAEVNAVPSGKLYYRNQDSYLPDLAADDWYVYLTPNGADKPDINACWIVVYYIQV